MCRVLVDAILVVARTYDGRKESYARFSMGNGKDVEKWIANHIAKYRGFVNHAKKHHPRTYRKRTAYLIRIYKKGT